MSVASCPQQRNDHGHETQKTKGVSVSIEGKLPKMTLDMPVDAKKIKAIQKCLENGKLTITMSKVDLAGGRMGEGYLYD
ncbi:hypothetical protein AQ708_26395 [Burkholderia pseudomallei]|nr:hypothetical protein AQ708_26395 [Burkholderia pseudomallei]OMT89953.1 hypothetical protein AQ767_30805 [Burkholderia pseudomallei]